MQYDDAWIQNAIRAQQQGYIPDNPYDIAVKAYMEIAGRPPTVQELFSAAQQHDINGYVASMVGQQQAQKQGQDVIKQSYDDQRKAIEDLINQRQKQTIQDLSPGGEGYTSLTGNLNNSGLLNSGAFSDILAKTLAKESAQATTDLASGTISPQYDYMREFQLLPQQQAMELPGQYRQQGFDWRAFSDQADLARQLSGGNGMGVLPYFSTAFQGLNAGANAYGAAKRPTYICTEMMECGVLTEEQVNKIHDHLFRAFWRRPLSFVGYFFMGKLLVRMCNSCQTNWCLWKDDFYTDVMEESDPAKAVDIYRQSFWRLFRMTFYKISSRYMSCLS